MIPLCHPVCRDVRIFMLDRILTWSTKAGLENALSVV